MNYSGFYHSPSFIVHFILNGYFIVGNIHMAFSYFLVSKSFTLCTKNCLEVAKKDLTALDSDMKCYLNKFLRLGKDTFYII